MVVSFGKRKADFLAKADKSSKGSWDKRIAGLCDKINKSKDYFTLSSCSGRIVLIKNIAAKKHSLFVFRSHQKIGVDELKRELNKCKGDVIFKQEPLILHVACRDMSKAEALLKLAQKAGCKHSGIIAVSGNRVVVEITGSESLGLPIVVKGKVIVDDEFLRVLIREANDRLVRTWSKIKKLQKII